MPRLPFFALALVALLSGVWAGIIRLGFDLPGIELATLHGPLMVGGFVGTIIGIERSLLSGSSRWWIVPATSGGAILLWLAGFQAAAPVALVASSALLVMMQAFQLKSQNPLPVTIIQLTGALCFLTGNLQLALSPFMPAIVPWWMGFVLCFILATRLSDGASHSRLWQIVTVAGLVTFLVSLPIPFHWNGHVFTGVGMMLIALGMLMSEADGLEASRSLKAYSALAIALGWGWLLLAGIGVVFWHEHIYGYDATVHAFFLGFLFSMVFAHALGKAQNLAGLKEPPFHPVLFAWLLLLSLSLVARVFAGDLQLVVFAKKWAGIVNGLAILGFLVSLIAITLRKKYLTRHGRI